MTEEGFDLEGTTLYDESNKWDGISEVILGNPDWFEIWLTAEKQCKSSGTFPMEQQLTFFKSWTGNTMKSSLHQMPGPWRIKPKKTTTHET